MAINTGSLGAGGPVAPARPLIVSRARTGRRILTDRWASRLVIVGGILIIACILAILVVIAVEVYPLFKPPTATFVGNYGTAASGRGPAPGDAIGVDEHREIAYTVTARGDLNFTALKGGRDIPAVAVQGLGDATVTFVAAHGKTQMILGTSDGRLIPLDLKFDVAFKDDKRSVTAAPTFGEPTALDPTKRRAVRRLAAGGADSGVVTVAQVGPADLIIQSVVEKKALIGGTRREESLESFVPELSGEITALKVDNRAEDLFIGTSQGQVLRYGLKDPTSPVLAEAVAASSTPGAPVTVLGFLLGDRTLVVGDQAGGVSTWLVVPPPGGGEKRLTRIHEFSPHAAPIVAITASRRDKSFATADASDGVHISYGTSGQTLLSFKAPRGLDALAFAPKTDALLAADRQGVVALWQVDDPHPEATLKTLFGKVWYEGYAQPAWVWQSTGGTDDFESKMSLVPLIFGTIKGTVYALVFAVPMALLAALYVSEFMHPSVKAYVKPAVEIMAALPSVVLGFLAGLWLAPILEPIVPGLFLMPLVLPVVILAAYALWRLVPLRIRARFKIGTEAFLLVPVVLVGIWIALWLGGLVENTLMQGAYRGWILSGLGLTYDQRNSLVVGIAMGFAVIPIIFTIAEDSLANVPGHLRAGSLALGATRWQTALRIVLPTGSPGIFSAIMIGLGRAVGETMIVLMATGNTPIMDWNVFSGFRAMSANIAVELPEAPDGGTLYRVLFLSALLLFFMTFVLNTAAELIRLKLRRKYRYL